MLLFDPTNVITVKQSEINILLLTFLYLFMTDDLCPQQQTQSSYSK